MEEQTASKISKEDQKILNSFKIINPDAENLVQLVKNITNFNYQLNSLKDISNFLTEDNIYILQNLNYRDNIKINLLLVKIYINIITNPTLYSNYLVEYTEEKLHLILQIFDECITLIQKLPGFILDEEIFKFKEKTLSLIKCIYFNWKGKITNLAVTQKLEEYIDTLPEMFYSETFNKMNLEKDSLDILNSIDLEKIKNFEDKFQQINSYYEQFEIFKKFVEMNSGIVTYDGIGESGLEKKFEQMSISHQKEEFYQQYGFLLLKFCKYHHYIFLNQENKEEDNIIKSEDNNTRVVFLLDKIKQYKDEEGQTIIKEGESGENTIQGAKGGKNIVELMSKKSFISINDCEEYNELIKKEINKYLEITKSYEEDSKFKSIIEQMNYFLTSIEKESYVPLYLTNFGKISVLDNFTPSFMINVSAGKTNEFYLETKADETMLIFIEFNLENQSKDINFEVNKYEIYSDEFKNIFKEEKVEKRFKLFLLCSGYSLYQIIFDNYYSWFTSKDINYKITLLKMGDKPVKNLDLEDNIKEINEEEINEEKKEDIKEEKKEEIKEEKKEKIKEENMNEIEEDNPEEFEEVKNENDIEDNNMIKCNINGKDLNFDIKEISQKIKAFSEKKNENEINIPIILYSNTLRIISFKDNKYSIKEYKNSDEDEEEDLVTKSFFEYRMKNYLSKVLKLKTSDCKNKKITISIFSQNRDLSLINQEISQQINSLKSSPNNVQNINYLQKIGFIPGNDIEGYKVDFILYDLCEQCLLYYLFKNNLAMKKSLLFILFDSKVVNASLFNEGIITDKLKDKKICLSNIKCEEESIKKVLKDVYDTDKNINIVLSCVDYKEEEKKKLAELIGTIQKYCEKEIKVNVVVCDENQVANDVFNYMNLFYKN